MKPTATVIVAAAAPMLPVSRRGETRDAPGESSEEMMKLLADIATIVGTTGTILAGAGLAGIILMQAMDWSGHAPPAIQTRKVEDKMAAVILSGTALATMSVVFAPDAETLAHTARDTLPLITAVLIATAAVLAWKWKDQPAKHLAIWSATALGAFAWQAAFSETNTLSGTLMNAGAVALGAGVAVVAILNIVREGPPLRHHSANQAGLLAGTSAGTLAAFVALM